MKLLITGACGFVGSSVARSLLETSEGLSITGIDNLMRPGSEINRTALRKLGVTFVHADIRNASDFEALPAADWILDAAANPSVLAGLGRESGSRQLCEHNLSGTVNVLEYAKLHRAGMILLSSSRVYSIPELCALPLKSADGAYSLDTAAPLPPGVSEEGIEPRFSTAFPISLYGATKLACEALALEYGSAFDFPVWVNRCGVLAGAGQFGTPDQGIFSYWVHAHRARRPLRYLGFDGTGKQVRDALHPRDLAALVDSQVRCARSGGQRLYTAAGGRRNAISLANLNAWCDARFGCHEAKSDGRPRAYDVPWLIMDSRDSLRDWGWTPQIALDGILEEIASHAESHPDWLERSGL